MNISDYYRIGSQQPELDFVDIILNTDNPLFIDPRLIEHLQGSLMIRMQKRIEAFWGELIKAVKSKDLKRVYYILHGLKEPNETRLGYAFSKRKGNSVAEKLKSKLVDAIIANKAVQSGILSHYADVELFIEDISSDRISDITTKIIKEVLIEFTQEQCEKHDIPMVLVEQDDIFDYKTLKWRIKKVYLPIYEEHPILFVPKNIVRLEGTAGKNISCFYRFAIRNFLRYDQDLIEDISPSGKDGKLLIRDIKSEHPLSKDSLVNWSLKYGKLLVDYKTDHLNGRLRELSDEEIMEVVYNNGLDLSGAV